MKQNKSEILDDADYYNYEGPVAAIDILGFGELLRTKNIKYIKENIIDKLQEATRNARYWTNREIRKATGNLSDPDSGEYNILDILFSDTILLITTGETTKRKELADLSMASMCRFCEILMQQSLNNHIALRGAISYGKCYLSLDPLYYIGKPIYEVFNLEKKQDWSGIVISDNASKYLKQTNLYTEYEVPFKSNDKINRLNRKKMKVLDWTMSPYIPDFEKCFDSEEEEVVKKKINTIEFFVEMGFYKSIKEFDQNKQKIREKNIKLIEKYIKDKTN